jgi:hypothetical protein
VSPSILLSCTSTDGTFFSSPAVIEQIPGAFFDPSAIYKYRRPVRCLMWDSSSTSMVYRGQLGEFVYCHFLLSEPRRGP